MRRLGERDLEAIRRHFLALPTEDRRLRFGMLMRDGAIHTIVDSMKLDRDYVYGVFAKDRKTLLAIVELVPMRNDAAAEIAISVIPQAQRRGIGSALFTRGLELLRDMGRTKVFFQILHTNLGMRAIAHKCGAVMGLPEFGEIECEIAL